MHVYKMRYMSETSLFFSGFLYAEFELYAVSCQMPDLFFLRNIISNVLWECESIFLLVSRNMRLLKVKISVYLSSNDTGPGKSFEL